MNRGCVALGDIKCDNCKRLIEAGQRYLVADDEKGKKFHFCMECSVARGHAYYVKEKGEEVLSFFPQIIEPVIAPLPVEEVEVPQPKAKGLKPEIIKEKPKTKEKDQKPKAKDKKQGKK
ncbi:MAG TPA: hypothetical protein VF366_05060 [Dehalococcoidia bacterium]